MLKLICWYVINILSHHLVTEAHRLGPSQQIRIWTYFLFVLLFVVSTTVVQCWRGCSLEISFCKFSTSSLMVLFFSCKYHSLTHNREISCAAFPKFIYSMHYSLETILSMLRSCPEHKTDMLEITWKDFAVWHKTLYSCWVECLVQEKELSRIKTKT